MTDLSSRTFPDLLRPAQRHKIQQPLSLTVCPSCYVKATNLSSAICIREGERDNTLLQWLLLLSLGSLPHLECPQIWPWETWVQELKKQKKDKHKFNRIHPKHLQSQMFACYCFTYTMQVLSALKCY